MIRKSYIKNNQIYYNKFNLKNILIEIVREMNMVYLVNKLNQYMKIIKFK